jgi:hypothetical protein
MCSLYVPIKACVSIEGNSATKWCAIPAVRETRPGRLQYVGKLSFVGEAGTAQAKVQRLFAQCPIWRIGDPWLVGAPPGQ